MPLPELVREQTASEVISGVQAYHAEERNLSNEELDQMIFGASIVDYDRQIFRRFGGDLVDDNNAIKVSDVSLYMRGLDLSRQTYGDEKTWGPGGPGIWTDYFIARGIVKKLNMQPTDKLYDLGSGYGRVPIYAGITTPAECVGLELVPERTELTEAAVSFLGLQNVTTRAGDIRDQDYSDGTVFYMFEPFHFRTFKHVVRELELIALDHPIRLATRISGRHFEQKALFKHLGQSEFTNYHTQHGALYKQTSRINFYESAV
jgi:predicted RNA methylase